MTNREKFFEVFGYVPNFGLEMVEKESEKQYNFVAFLQEWWYDNYKEGTSQNVRRTL